jgi:hypothetical protein
MVERSERWKMQKQQIKPELEREYDLYNLWMEAILRHE